MGMAKPKEGVMGWCDTCAIPKNVSPESAAAAHELINYVLGPDYGHKLALEGPYAISTSTARYSLSAEEQEHIFINDLSVMDSIVWKENPANYGKWARIWNEVKAS